MDPQCNLFINGNVDVFQTILDLCDADGTKFKLASLSLLNCLLGIQWYVRIKNEQGDYAFIEDNTCGFANQETSQATSAMIIPYTWNTNWNSHQF